MPMQSRSRARGAHTATEAKPEPPFSGNGQVLGGKPGRSKLVRNEGEAQGQASKLAIAVACIALLAIVAIFAMPVLMLWLGVYFKAGQDPLVDDGPGRAQATGHDGREVRIAYNCPAYGNDESRAEMRACEATYTLDGNNAWQTKEPVLQAPLFL